MNIKVELPDSINNAILNITDELTKSAGTTISDIWFLVFGNISHKVEKQKMRYTYELELYRKELENSISLIPESKKIEPSTQITAQALENSKYCVEEPILRKMFTALISNSMNSDYSQIVHPSFAEIIKQMSVLDAIIIQIFKNQYDKNMPVCKYIRILDNGSYIVIAHNIIPCDSTIESIGASSYDCAKSLTSLERLGLISINYDMEYNDSSKYDEFINSPFHLELKAEYPDDEVTIQKGFSALTLLGDSFARCCIPD